MKKSALPLISIAVMTLLLLMSATQMLEERYGQEAPEHKQLENFTACPNGPVTVQGCVTEDDGCYSIHTINGRTIAIGIYGYNVGAGDEISLTGNWQTDADCAPCLLNATSVTDLGNCN